MTILRGDKAPTVGPPDPNPKKPAITLPPLSCDAHFHVFGPRAVFRFADDRPYTPQDAPKEDLFALHKLLGFERGVFVQSTTHGKDHAVVIDLIAAANGRYRGVGLIDPSTPKAEVARLSEAGICGARFHFVAHLGEAMPPDDIRAVVAMIAPHGWHVAAHVGPGGVLDYYDFLASLPTQVVVDHIGRMDVGEGRRRQGVRGTPAPPRPRQCLGEALRAPTASPGSPIRIATRCRSRARSPSMRPSAWCGAPTGRTRTTRRCRTTAPSST